MYCRISLDSSDKKDMNMQCQIKAWALWTAAQGPPLAEGASRD